MKNKIVKASVITSIALMCILLDQISKMIAINNLVENSSKEVIKNFFAWTLCFNTGGAWSIFSNNTMILTVISIIALALIIFTLVKSKNKFYTISATFFMGGLIGNLIDRIVKGKVTDFIDFKIFGYDFPVFNIADIFIVLGGIFIAISIILEDSKEKKEEEKDVRNTSE